MDRNVFVATLAILLISVFIGFNFIYQPKMDELRHLEQMQREEEEKKVLFDEMTGFEKRIEAYRMGQIPIGREEIELLNRVREIADASGVQVTALIPQPKQGLPKKGYRKYPISVSFGATYHHLGDFVEKVEGTRPFMKIDKLQFQATPRKKEESFLTCQVVLSIFSIP